MKLTAFDDSLTKDPDIISLFHASTEVVNSPRWDYKSLKRIRENRDFGTGFYCSDGEIYPMYLYSGHDVVYMNQYLFNLSGLKVLKLGNDIKWLIVVACHRSNFTNFPKYHFLRDEVRRYLSSFDVVIGTVSDDNYYSVMDLFMRNLITDFVAIGVSQMMNFGMQFVTKSNLADSNFSFVSSYEVDSHVLLDYKLQYTRDRAAMEERVAARMISLHGQDTGQFFMTILEDIGTDVENWLYAN